MAADAAPAAFPWDEVMAVGLGVLRLPPEAFWAMTPREFERAVRAGLARKGSPPSRAQLAALMTAFPDEGRARWGDTRNRDDG